MDLLEPKSVTINGRDFIFSKFTAVAGREIAAKYILSSIPKLGDYAVNQETMLKLMNFVAVGDSTRPLRLSTIALVDNHVGDWETLTKIEWEMMEYNCSFFRDGRVSNLWQDFAQKVRALISKTSTVLSALSSQMEKQRSMN